MADRNGLDLWVLYTDAFHLDDRFIPPLPRIGLEQIEYHRTLAVKQYE